MLMRSETAVRGTLVLFYGTLFFFSSAIFCTDHNGAEMHQVSCSLQLILLKSRKYKKYCRCLAFLRLLRFNTPPPPPFFWLFPQSWVEIKQHRTVSFNSSQKERRYFFLFLRGVLKCLSAEWLSFWKSQLSIRPSSGPSITENKIKNGNDHRKVEIFLEI